MRTLEGIDTNLICVYKTRIYELEDMRTLEGIDTTKFFNESNKNPMLEDMRTLEGIDTFSDMHYHIISFSFSS